MPNTEITLQQAINQYLDNLKGKGKKPRTLYTYSKDCEQIVAFFGPDKLLKNILPVHVAGFYKSDALLKIQKNGRQRQPETIRKTKRVLRMLLFWAKEQKYLNAIPLPKSEMIPYNE